MLCFLLLMTIIQLVFLTVRVVIFSVVSRLQLVTKLHEVSCLLTQL